MAATHWGACIRSGAGRAAGRGDEALRGARCGAGRATQGTVGRSPVDRRRGLEGVEGTPLRASDAHGSAAAHNRPSRRLRRLRRLHHLGILGSPRLPGGRRRSRRARCL
jgi:hypothetical protein